MSFLKKSCLFCIGMGGSSQRLDFPSNRIISAPTRRIQHVEFKIIQILIECMKGSFQRFILRATKPYREPLENTKIFWNRNIYALSARYCGPRSSSMKISILSWRDRLFQAHSQAGSQTYRCFGWRDRKVGGGVEVRFGVKVEDNFWSDGLGETCSEGLGAF